LPDEVELHAEPGRLVVQGARRPRTGWAEAARARGEVHLVRLDPTLNTSAPCRFERQSAPARDVRGMMRGRIRHRRTRLGLTQSRQPSRLVP
jgi:hypothetical protein